MAFNSNNPPILVTSRGTGAAPGVWVYSTQDSLTEVLAAGYFSGANNIGLRVGDFILIRETDNAQAPSIICVSDITGNAGAAVAVVPGNSPYTGWADYLDTQFSSGSPWQPTPNQWTNFPHNSGTTIKVQLPQDVTDLFADSKILGREGDGLMVTVELLARPTTATTTFLNFATFIGNNLGPLADGRIYTRPFSFPKGQGQIQPVTFTTGMFTLNTFEANGGTLQFNPTAAIDIWSVRTVVHRTHKAR